MNSSFAVASLQPNDSEGWEGKREIELLRTTYLQHWKIPDPDTSSSQQP